MFRRRPATEGTADLIQELRHGGGFDAGLAEPGTGYLLTLGHVHPVDLDRFGERL